MLSDVVNFAISMSVKFKDEIDFATFDNLMEEDENVVYKFSCLASNIKNEVTQVLELLIFMCYQVDVKDIKCPLQWWEKHESMFPTIGFCIRQIFGIVGCQIEIEKKISLARIVITKYLLEILIAE